MCTIPAGVALSGLYPPGANEVQAAAYRSITHGKPQWKRIARGLEFTRIEIQDDKTAVDTVAVLRIDPESNKIRVFNSFDHEKTVVHAIEEWQAKTGALAMINSAQYMADPYYMPCALVICDGKQKGLKGNKSVRGMLVAEPQNSKLAKADLLDFEYDSFVSAGSSYTQGVEHWPILLDRKGKIKVQSTPWKANRTVVAKDFRGNLLFFTTEGGFFTLYDFGLFLKRSNERQDQGFRVHTAMNMDGGNEAQMIVSTPDFSYKSYEKSETNASGKVTTIFKWKIRMPGVIGVFPRA